MTLAQMLASVHRNSRDELVEAVEDALDGHTDPEAFLVMAYFLALAINRLPCCDRDTLLDDMPRILRRLMANQANTVTLQ